MINRLIIALNIGFREILNNKMRSFLSIFAVSIGVFTFIFVFSAVNYAKAEEKKVLSIMGQNSLLLAMTIEQVEKTKLTFKDIKDIYALSKDIIDVSPYEDNYVFFPMNGKFYASSVMGITPSYKRTSWLYELKEGRLITWDDVLEKRKVALLIKDPLINREKGNYANVYHNGIRNDFKWIVYNKAMLGKQLRFYNDKYTIIGILEAPLYKNDYRLFPRGDDFLIPITSMAETVFSAKRFSHAIIEVNHPENVEQVQRKLTAYLRQKHGNRKEPFDIKKLTDIAAEKMKSLRQNILLISLLGLIAMISGGIGIMNVVLATIYARTKEIGIRRALGASKADIFWQFTVESITLNILGACAGYIICLFALDYAGEMIKMPTQLNLQAVIYAFMIATLTGFIFSLYPALKAANMNPVDSLKTE